MHILLTGASGALGQAVAAHLRASGREVSEAGATPGDPATRAADGADVVIHLAPVEPGARGSAGLTGLIHVANAAARSGARLILPIPAAGDPDLYGQAEDLAMSSWGPTVVVRCAPLLGPLDDWTVARTVATLRNTSHGGTTRVLHSDDLIRFLGHAVRSDRTGRLDLASSDAITYVAARRLLADVAVRRHAATWPVPDPPLNLAALHDDWSFECGWSPSDAVTDTAAAFGRDLPAVAAPRPPVAGTDPAPAGVAGEFDYRIDAAFPRFGSTGTSDALPGPLTPLTLDVEVGGLRAAQRVTAAALGLPAALADEWADRATAVFGHRLFVGESVAAALRPGLATLRRMLGLSRGYRARCAGFATTVRGAERDRAALEAFTDAQLDTRILLLRNQIQQGWTLASVGVPIEGAFHRMARRPAVLIPQPAAMTATGHLAAETAALADRLRTDTALRELAAAGDLAALRSAAPEFGSAFDAAAARVGHRGPGEAELAHPVIADAPEHLLVAAARAAGDHPAAPPDTPTDPAAKRAEAARTARELAWDTTARATHQLRITLREKGARMVAAGTVDADDDVLYLTCAELVDPPATVREVIERRRAERSRLENLTLPDAFDGGWTPVEDVAESWVDSTGVTGTPA